MQETKTIDTDETKCSANTEFNDAPECYKRYGWKFSQVISTKDIRRDYDGSVSYSGTVSDSGTVYLTKHVTPGSHDYLKKYKYEIVRYYENDTHKKWLHFYEAFHYYLYRYGAFILFAVAIILFIFVSNNISRANRTYIPFKDPYFIAALSVAAYGGYQLLLKHFLNIQPLLLYLLTLPIRLIAIRKINKNSSKV